MCIPIIPAALKSFSKDSPLNFNNLVTRCIKPYLAKAEIPWHRWNAFRRGLATNLYRLGVPGKNIQETLRHANLSTAMNSYVKSVHKDPVAAMWSLEQACT